MNIPNYCLKKFSVINLMTILQILLLNDDAMKIEQILIYLSFKTKSTAIRKI